ncbi:unnamed protein product [Cuscuta epithymum]|uniref:Uncharacterized protein n=1 Tax=Cuscuta epithymum TaxID=186058 RepID=A0AAV0F0Q6_9ASTE|nr:unnamed protein product [Cuscuta epithymum]
MTFIYLQVHYHNINNVLDELRWNYLFFVAFLVTMFLMAECMSWNILTTSQDPKWVLEPSHVGPVYSLFIGSQVHLLCLMPPWRCEPDWLAFVFGFLVLKS